MSYNLKLRSGTFIKHSISGHGSPTTSSLTVTRYIIGITCQKQF